MPTSKKLSAAPAGRVHKSEQPKQQAKFPTRSTRVRGYGSAGGVKVPKLQKQDTLTQMDFVKMAERELELELEPEEELSDEERSSIEKRQAQKVEVGEMKESKRTTRLRSNMDNISVQTDDIVLAQPSETIDEDLLVSNPELPRSTRSSTKRRRTLNDHRSDCGDVEHTGSSRKKSKSIQKVKSARRKTVGDIVSNTSTPQYQTQTITQLDWGLFHPRSDEKIEEEAEVEDQIVDEEEGYDSAIFDVPSSSQLLKSAKVTRQYKALPNPDRIKYGSPELGNGANMERIERAGTLAPESFDSTILGVRSSSQTLPPPRRHTRLLAENASPQQATSPNQTQNTIGVMGPPQTPKRALAREIPSSESPATPAFLRSGASQGRSPLQVLPSNTPIPFNLDPSLKSASPQRPPKLVIEDTYETATDISQMQRIPSSPSKKSSPAKSVRFALPGKGPASSPVQASKKVTFAKSVVLDSDAESDDNLENEEEEAKEESQMEHRATDSRPFISSDTCYGEFGNETQLEIDQLVSTTSSSHVTDSQAHEHSTQPQTQRDVSHSPTLTQPKVYDEEDGEDHHSNYEEKTQFRESQRLHTQHLRSFAPRTLNSDIFVSIASSQMTGITTGARNHDIRGYGFPDSAVRVWYYVSKPIHKLTYMAVIGPGKRPGDIITDEEKVGNKQFNSKHRGSNWHAYEVEELYELADPLTMEELRQNEWLDAAPKKFENVRPAVIDSLIANLMPPMFSKHEIEEDVEEEEEEEPNQITEPERVSEEAEALAQYANPRTQSRNKAQSLSSSANDTQEAAEQLLNTMKQFNQFDSIPTQRFSNSNEIEETDRIPSSQDELMLPPPYVRPVPKHEVELDQGLSQATTVDLTQTQNLFSVTTPRKVGLAERDIVWESPTRPVHPSTPAQLSMGVRSSSGLQSSGFRAAGSSGVVPFSIPSSQMLTKSQMDREIVYDSIPAPPLEFVEDSDEDEIEDF